MAYGVTPVGFLRKSLAQILAEIEQDNRDAIDAGVVQTPESPLGQLNGVFAEQAARLWEVAEAVYQAYDPDQAEGTRLDILARVRLLERAANEGDAAFRQAITNVGRARIDLSDLLRALRGLTGVTYAAAFANDADTPDADGVAGHSVAVAVIGGDDAEIATAIRRYVVPGVGTHGNTMVSVTIDGFCRSIRFVRPTERRVFLSLDVTLSNDKNGCPPPSFAAIKTALVELLTGDARPLNGADITLHLLRTVLACRFPNVEIVSAGASFSEEGPFVMPLAVAFDEIATFDAEAITLT